MAAPLDPSTGTRARESGRARAGIRIGAALVLLLALALRLVALDSGGTSPDDGEYLRSARIESLEPGVDLARALREDRAWAGMLIDDFGTYPERVSYQHGYLHQLAIRWAWRIGGVLGIGRVSALRIDQALLGAATALLAFLWLRRAVPREPAVALVGGALVAAQLAHVHLSRTGWSQVGCTFFLVWMIAVAWRMRATPEADRRGLRRCAAGIAATSLLAYGFHEMASVYVVVLAVIVVLELGRDELGRRRRPWRSVRVAYGLAACAPVGAATLGLLLFSDYARATWFEDDLLGLGWRRTRELAWQYFAEVDLAAQLGWAILALAPIGFVGAVLRDAAWARWLALWCALPTALLFLRFNYPHLVRIYLPAVVLLALLAAEGAGVLIALARGRVARAAVALALVAAVAFTAFTSWQTLQAPASAVGHVHGVHSAGAVVAEPRRPLTPLVEILRAEVGASDAPIGVSSGRLDPLYRLLDAGLRAELFDPRWPLERWPERVVAPVPMMAKSEHFAANGGPYRLRVADRFGAVGLYQR